MVDFVVICIVLPVLIGGAYGYRNEIVAYVKSKLKQLS